MKGRVNMATGLTIERILELLADEPDVLTSEAERDKEYLRRLSCPKCGAGGITKEVNSLRPFTSYHPLPNWNGRCPVCKCLYSPTSGVIIEG